MIQAIKVKTIFSGWHEVTQEQAQKGARHMYNGANCSHEKKILFLDKHISGITAKELLKETKEEEQK